MQPRERLIVYTLLAAGLLLNAIVLLGHTATPAFADPAPIFDKLGPTDGVILAGETELDVRNADGHIAWGDTEHQRAYSIAFVHISAVMNKIVELDEYSEAREELREDLEARGLELGEEQQALIDEYGDPRAIEPDNAEAIQAWQEWSARAQEFQNEQMTRVTELSTEQITRAYREMVEAVEVVADDRDIDIVYRFIPTSDEFESANPGEARMEIRLRSALRYPDALDITDYVLEEMSLPIE